ncbi:MAG: sulfite exporter TauE/SafE family protein [Deltaproteobacteria bacterium]|nr:sulfite exporter TauE/SafE family protein [Deltaproteobacteria bacterium]
MNELGFVVSGFALGFLGSTHCVAMCGGFAGALSMALPARRQTPSNLLLMHGITSTGRLTSYAIAGAFSGALGSLISDIVGAYGSHFLRLAAGVLVLLLGLYLAGWSTALARLEAMGGRVWRRINSLVGRQRPSDPFAAAFVFGMVWGWLPCGLVYTVLALAATTSHASEGASLMLGFGAGTLPMMLVTGVVTGRIPTLLRRPASRRLAGALMVVFGAWTIAATTVMHHGGSASPEPCASHFRNPG